MNDAELIATAALANVEAVLMAGDNAEAELYERIPVWRAGTGMMEYGEKLREELYRREKVRNEDRDDAIRETQQAVQNLLGAKGGHAALSRGTEQLRT